MIKKEYQRPVSVGIILQTDGMLCQSTTLNVLCLSSTLDREELTNDVWFEL